MSGISNKQNPIDIIASAVEKQKNSLVAICTHSWHLPVYKQTVSYELSTMRRATALEEYIMKAAAMELSYDVDVKMLPSLLGLDEVFFEEAIESLADKSIIDKDALPILRLTEPGKTALELGKVYGDAVVHSLEYYIDRKFATVYASPKDEPRLEMHPKYALIDKAKENASKYLSRKFVVEAGKTVGKEVENLAEGTRVAAISSVKTTDAVRTLFTEFYFYDFAENKFVRKVWDYARKCFHEGLAQLLDSNGIDSGFKAEVCKVPAIAEDIRALACGDNADSVKIYRGAAKEKLIEQIFSNSSNLIVHIPSLTPSDVTTWAELVVSKKQSEARLLLSYGVCPGEEAETELDVLRSLIAKNDEQCGKIAIVQNHECKMREIIVDNSLCVISGIGWASVTGSFNRCSEAVYAVSDDDFVRQRIDYWQNQHNSHICDNNS